MEKTRSLLRHGSPFLAGKRCLLARKIIENKVLAELS
jgi:hypothetical protein